MFCTRCGSTDAHDYGSDGLVYCSSCLFYGINKPCWKCRMYLPSSELQTYRGQLACQYCIMDLKDEERRIEERGKREEKKKDRYISEDMTGEHCDRCGRELSTVYYYNGRHLCSTCMEEEKKDWKSIGGERPPMSMHRVKAERSRLSTIVAAAHKMMNEFLGFISKRIVAEEEKSRKEKERVRLEEKMGAAKDDVLDEKLQTTGQKIKGYKIEEPERLPLEKKAESEKRKNSRKETKKEKIRGERKGKRLGFEKFSGSGR